MLHCPKSCTYLIFKQSYIACTLRNFHLTEIYYIHKSFAIREPYGLRISFLFSTPKKAIWYKLPLHAQYVVTLCQVHAQIYLLKA